MVIFRCPEPFEVRRQIRTGTGWTRPASACPCKRAANDTRNGLKGGRRNPFPEFGKTAGDSYTHVRMRLRKVLIIYAVKTGRNRRPPAEQHWRGLTSPPQLAQGLVNPLHKLSSSSRPCRPYRSAEKSSGRGVNMAASMAIAASGMAAASESSRPAPPISRICKRSNPFPPAVRINPYFRIPEAFIKQFR